MPAPAMALDAKQLFEKEKPSSHNVWKFFFDARKKGEAKEAASALEYAAEQGDHAAQWKLGRMYQTGDGVKKDPAAAVRFFSQIVENYSDAQPGSADWQFTGNAMVALGRYYRDGVPEAGLKRDRSEAIIMFTTAADLFRPSGRAVRTRAHVSGRQGRRRRYRAGRPHAEDSPPTTATPARRRCSVSCCSRASTCGAIRCVACP